MAAKGGILPGVGEVVVEQTATSHSPFVRAYHRLVSLVLFVFLEKTTGKPVRQYLYQSYTMMLINRALHTVSSTTTVTVCTIILLY